MLVHFRALSWCSALVCILTGRYSLFGFSECSGLTDFYFSRSDGEEVKSRCGLDVCFPQE